jgi:hypothetical protein
MYLAIRESLGPLSARKSRSARKWWISWIASPIRAEMRARYGSFIWPLAPVASLPMSLIFSFCTGSTTFLAALLYLAIFTFLYITQYGPSVPSLQRQLALGFNLGQAYQDLHRVSFPGHAV